ncbi:MAG: ChaN family lipoprotein [Bdellovibrionaceae bacterium]|nr:ChaN family lipoprotein [Pseudobdellovibrionaceae bacterium]
MLLKSLKFLSLAGFSCAVSAAAASSGTLLRGSTLKNVSVLQAVSQVQPGEIVVIGEEHGQAGSQAGQLEILRALRARGLKVSVGMEFLEYPQQALTDAFRAGQLSETDFLRQVQWGSIPFDFYKDQVLFPEASEGGRTVALNIPRAVTSQVAKKGLDSLSPEQAQLLPPGLTRGNDRYFARFKDAVGGHLPDAAAAERYFMAQSVWDETMAWTALASVQQDPSQVLVIIVGEFHVQYGGGLPDRLRARGAAKVWTFSEVNLTGLTHEESREALSPSELDGPRADFLWIFKD